MATATKTRPSDEWAIRQRKAGKCVRCGKKRTPKSKCFCKSCLDERREYYKLRRKKAKLSSLQKEVAKLEKKPARKKK